MQAQLAQAAALAAQLRATDAGLAAASERLAALGKQKSVALERLATARAAETQASRVEALNNQLLTRLQGDLGAQRDALGEWARQTYTIGGPAGTYEGLLIALEAESSTQVARTLSQLQAIGVAGGNAVQRLQSTVATQADAVRQAALAKARAEAARITAGQAVAVLKGLQLQQWAAVAQLQLQQARIVGEDKFTGQQRANLVLAEQLVKAAGGVVTGSCRGLDTRGYPNGLIPLAALCPVWGTTGQYLRADAAAAFETLAKQFAAEFGRPLCTTDSYRTLAGQLKLYAEKPDLAATPGTSNHGWGAAVDLCGGIESFGTAEHAWMLVRAPLTGWFNPSWAGPAGSRPEPWHWEFGG